jgi:hypothetical protein
MSDPEQPGEPAKRRLHLDWVIRVDVVGLGIVILGAGLTTYNGIQTQLARQDLLITQNKEESARIERQTKEARENGERFLLDKINTNQTTANSINAMIAQGISEIKSTLVLVNQNLDRKADKPGR